MAYLKSRSLFVRDATGFVKGFGALDVVLIATSMIWALTYMVTQYPWFYGFNPGSDLSLALPIAAIPFAFLLLVYWGIGVIMPRSGSDYVWVSRIISAHRLDLLGHFFTCSSYSQLHISQFVFHSPIFSQAGSLFGECSTIRPRSLISAFFSVRLVDPFSSQYFLQLVFAVFADLGLKVHQGVTLCFVGCGVGRRRRYVVDAGLCDTSDLCRQVERRDVRLSYLRSPNGRS